MMFITVIQIKLRFPRNLHANPVRAEGRLTAELHRLGSSAPAAASLPNAHPQ